MARYPRENVKLTNSEIAADFGGPWAERYPPMLDTKQAASLLGVSVHAIHRMSSTGELNGIATRVAGKLRLHRDRLYRKAFEKGIHSCKKQNEK